jgi:hypothetical protein
MLAGTWKSSLRLKIAVPVISLIYCAATVKKERRGRVLSHIYHQDFLDFVANFNVGDRIRVQWTSKRQGIGRECYISEGKIVQITNNAIYIRGDVGFTAGINMSDIAMGVEVKQIS